MPSPIYLLKIQLTTTIELLYTLSPLMTVGEVMTIQMQLADSIWLRKSLLTRNNAAEVLGMLVDVPFYFHLPLKTDDFIPFKVQPEGEVNNVKPPASATSDGMPP